MDKQLRRRQNQELLDQLNAAYDDTPDASERMLQNRMVRLQRRLLKDGRLKASAAQTG